MLSGKLEECPHCGNNAEGYYYVVTMKYTQFRAWGNAEEGNNTDSGVGVDKHSACRCGKCNKIVRSLTT